jgi:predicted Zn-dependent protease
MEFAMCAKSSFSRLILSLPALILCAVLSSGCVSDRQVISQADQLHAGLQPAVMTEPQMSNYLEQVGQRIIATAQEMDRAGLGPESHRKEDSAWMYSAKMQFHLVNSKTLNAFTTGGEHMYIYNQLFQECSSEDALAAVMAHEYAHIYARHVAKGMNRQYAIIGVTALAGVGGYAAGGKEKGGDYASAFAGAALVAGQFVGMKYTRDDETEADKYGFQFYCRAGWDPNHFADFFGHMIDKGFDKTPAYLSDHPTLKSRVDAAKRRAAELPPNASQWRRPPVAKADQFRTLQARALQVAQTMPTDESLTKAQTLLAAFPSCVTPEDQPEQKTAQQQLQLEIQKIKSTKKN